MKRASRRGVTLVSGNLSAAMYILILLAVLIAGFSPFSALAQESVFMNIPKSTEDIAQVITNASPGIVLIIAYDNTGDESGRGNGFILDREGRIITNASVLKGAYSAEVRSLSRQYREIVILKQDEALDLALIKVEAVNERPLELDSLYEAAPGRRGIATGKNILMEETASEGVIQSVKHEDHGLELIEIRKADSALTLGSARNGPLLNLSGKVIGLITSEFNIHQVFGKMPLDDADQIIHAIGITSINHFLSGPDMAEPLHPARSRDWIAWLSNRLENAATIIFVTLYDIGFMKLIAILVGVMIFLSIIEWLITRIIAVLRSKKKPGRN